ncbi:MAG: histidine--tRNA ligase [Acidobacteriota bacterium]
MNDTRGLDKLPAMGGVHLAKGTRDFLPGTMIHRLRLVESVRSVFARFGFPPLETPALERIETLTGKYGQEGERLIFKILKRGAGAARGQADLALRYDLTVPLARVVALHPEILLPFKRSQIQPVWRADRPQKGRFREFWQCDADTVGTASRLADAECLAVLNACLEALGFREFTLRINHRQILSGLAAALGQAAREGELLTALDKLDRLGKDGVGRLLREKGFTPAHLARVWEWLERGGIPGTDGAEEELGSITRWAVEMGVPSRRIRLHRPLARGLDYYTGFVVEAEVDKPAVGAIGGGGRYDNLLGLFAGRRIPAVGVSLGLERVLAVMQETGMLEEVSSSTQVWVTIFSDETREASVRAARSFRDAGVATDLSLDGGKLAQQLKKADRRGIPHAIVVGPDEVAAGTVILRSLRQGEQWELSLDEAVKRVAGGQTA